jgi:hypothetical protein
MNPKKPKYSYGREGVNRLQEVLFHEGNTMRKIMGNKPQVSSAIIIHSPLQISLNDLLYTRVRLLMFP